jgi:uncharacterized protein YdhG (YjbR/CyaY superfamily)
MSPRPLVRLPSTGFEAKGVVMTAEDIDRYLAGVEEPTRGTLEEMRRRILEVIPDAEQCLSYALPAFKMQGKTVAGLAAFKNHLSYLPHSGSVLAALAKETRGYTPDRRVAAFPGRHTPDALPSRGRASGLKPTMRCSGRSTPWRSLRWLNHLW